MALTQLNSSGVVADLKVYLGSPPDFDQERAALVVDLAMERCEAIVSPVPALARAIVLDVARRGLTNPSEVKSEQAGPFQRTFRDQTIGVHLTEREEEQLKAMAADAAGLPGAFTITPGPRAAS